MAFFRILLSPGRVGAGRVCVDGPLVLIWAAAGVLALILVCAGVDRLDVVFTEGFAFPVPGKGDLVGFGTAMTHAG